MEFEDLSLSSQILYLTMYETRKLLQTLLLNIGEVDEEEERRERMEERKRLIESRIPKQSRMTGQRKFNQGSMRERESVERRVHRAEGQEQGRRRDEGQMGRVDQDEDVPAEELIMYLRNLNLTPHQNPESDPSTPEVLGDSLRPEVELPDCVPASSNRRFNRLPDVVTQKRSVFRLDSQWIHNAPGSRNPPGVLKNSGAPREPIGRRWSYSGAYQDEVDAGSLDWEAGIQGPEEMIPRLNPVSDRTWRQCGNDLARIFPVDELDYTPLLRTQSLIGARMETRTAPGRRHSTGTPPGSRVSGKKSLLSDMFVLVTLAGVYYCINKIKSLA